MIEELLLGIVFGCVTVTILGLIVMAYLQYRRGLRFKENVRWFDR
jgi:hypothetical protein